MHEYMCLSVNDRWRDMMMMMMMKMMMKMKIEG